MPRRVSYHDVASRATGHVPREKLARAIVRLQTAYREGRPLAAFHQESLGRAAYVVHTLPAHVCDLRRLFLDELEADIRRPHLRAVALGAGPGTEVLALADAWATLSSRDGEPPGKELTVQRVDRVGAWDSTFESTLAPAREALKEIDDRFGQAWTLDAPVKSLVADLLAPASEALLELVGKADLIVAANMLSELEPRGSSVLPGAFAANVQAIARAAPAGCVLVFIDRAQAPGTRARLEAAVAAAAGARASEASDIREREVRCVCSITRATKALYAHVRLPTTKVTDLPILSARSAFGIVRFS